MPVHEYVILNTGAKMPTVGLGTWKSAPGEVEHAVAYALQNGYRHIDTAAGYANEAEVGKGIKDSGVPREEIFLTTKLNNPDHRIPGEALGDSLKKLDTYIDLWLMHWPAPMTSDGKADKEHDWLDTWKEMERLYQAHPDKVRAIGVSNFSNTFLKRLLENCTVVPAVNQVELHPSCPQTGHRKFCEEKGIVMTAYSPLGSDNSPLLKNETVTELAEKYKVHPANILISLWANTPNATVIPKSVKEERIKSNFNIVSLTDDEIARLIKIGETQPFRACKPDWTGWGDLAFEYS
ncbi:hypothetical protein FRC02_006618 [Tulasnella sp. 418]|nr:hypothetical protein FRC02_006618 [Tulasnella sp. 418]